MSKTGYPTPDNPVGEMDFICKSIFIPNDDAFVRVLAGQIAEACNYWYYKNVGTMTREQAAEYMSRALAMVDWNAECGEFMACEDIADCIDTDANVQTALVNAGNNANDLYGNVNPDKLTPAGTENTTIINNRFPPAERDVPAKELVDCNLDELWSGIYFMVQQLDTVGRDWLEQAVASGDKWQRAASIAKNIPIIGSLASTALEQLAEVAQDLLNLYNAYSTESALQEIACAIFETVCSECRYPTYDEIADYYGSNSTITGGNLAEISLKAMVDFLIGSSLAISQLAYHTIISMVLFTLWLGSEFVGLRGAKWIPIWLDNGEEYANDEWIVLCDGCEPPFVAWKYTIDFTTLDDGRWVRSAGYGISSEGVGFIDGGAFKQSSVYIPFTELLNVVHIEFEVNRIGGTGSSSDSHSVRWNTNGSETFPAGNEACGIQFEPNGIQSECCGGDLNNIMALALLARVADTGAGAAIYIRSATIYTSTQAYAEFEGVYEVPVCP